MQKGLCVDVPSKATAGSAVSVLDQVGMFDLAEVYVLPGFFICCFWVSTRG